jgi:hypothetical protein
VGSRWPTLTLSFALSEPAGTSNGPTWYSPRVALSAGTRAMTCGGQFSEGEFRLRFGVFLLPLPGVSRCGRTHAPAQGHGAYMLGIQCSARVMQGQGQGQGQGQCKGNARAMQGHRAWGIQYACGRVTHACGCKRVQEMSTSWRARGGASGACRTAPRTPPVAQANLVRGNVAPFGKFFRHGRAVNT